MPSTPLAYASAHTFMSCCTCTHPFGWPVLPDEYNQKAGASALVGSASSAGDAVATSASNDMVRASRPCGSSPTTTTWPSELQCSIAGATASSSSALTTI